MRQISQTLRCNETSIEFKKELNKFDGSIASYSFRPKLLKFGKDGLSHIFITKNNELLYCNPLRYRFYKISTLLYEPIAIETYDNVILVGDTESNIHFYNIEDCSLMFTFDLGSEAIKHIIAYDGRLLFASNKRIYIFEKDNFEQICLHETPAENTIVDLQIFNHRPIAYLDNHNLYLVNDDSVDFINCIKIENSDLYDFQHFCYVDSYLIFGGQYENRPIIGIFSFLRKDFLKILFLPETRLSYGMTTVKKLKCFVKDGKIFGLCKIDDGTLRLIDLIDCCQIDCFGPKQKLFDVSDLGYVFSSLISKQIILYDLDVRIKNREKRKFVEESEMFDCKTLSVQLI
eukprot:TRINITY_DN732_c0_g1_i1.p1 TRINITY_DN732_c0_g1~~TRINITY_DN732_c0_g1_i1.p1  ORF type:complete len:345 (+),score=77.12 TRINITY_DN732_c0_g1_i1:297-1331(+)